MNTPSVHSIRQELEAENFALRDKSVPCDFRSARQLTAQIQASAVHTFMLLFEAHQRLAWRALGYESFADYVAAEFGMSRGHAYRLLDLARVVKVIEEAAALSPMGDTNVPGVSTDVDISERDARALKGDLPALEAAVKEATEGVEDEAERARLAAEAARAERARLEAEERHRRDAAARTRLLHEHEFADAAPAAEVPPVSAEGDSPRPVVAEEATPPQSSAEATPSREADAEPPRSTPDPKPDKPKDMRYEASKLRARILTDLGALTPLERTLTEFRLTGDHEDWANFFDALATVAERGKALMRGKTVRLVKGAG